MPLNEILDTYTAYAKPMGVGTLVGVATYAIAAIGQGIWGRRTNVPEQLHSGTNMAIGATAGILTAIAAFDPNLAQSGREISEIVINATGTIIPGAATGAVLYTLIRSGASRREGLRDHLGEKLRMGSFRGALAFPAGYLLMEITSKYF